MKIKVYTIDVQFPRWAKRSLAAGISAVILVGLAVIVRAAPTVTIHTFQPNETLTANNLNGNFAALKDAIETMTISAPAVTAGTFGDGVLIPASQVSGTVASATNATNATYASNAAPTSALAAALGRTIVVKKGTATAIVPITNPKYNEAKAACPTGYKAIAVSCTDYNLNPPMILARAMVLTDTQEAVCGYANAGTVEQSMETTVICLGFE